MDKMTKEQAAELLKNYQQWRKGRVDYFPVSPAKVSRAIEVAIENLTSTDIKVGDSDEPDWSKAPWANYYGIDADGSRWFYEKEPHVDGSSYDQNTGDFTKDEELGRMKLLKRPEQ